MADAFFTEVPDRIPFGGLESTDPLAFKVYDPDRLVLGKRMEDHLRIARLPLALVRLAGLGRVRRRHVRPAVARRPARPDGRRAGRSSTPRSSSSTKLGVPYYCFHDRDVAPEGATFARDPGEPRRGRRRRRPAHGADRACGCCGAPPTCSATRATRPARPPTPIPRSSPTPRRRSSTCSRRPSGSAARTTSCGAAARATRRCSTRTSSARARSSPGSCTSSPSTSTGSASRARS